MSIKQYIDELTKIKNEIKINTLRNKDLRKRAGDLESNISEYLKSKDQEGLKYNGQAIIVENKEKYATKPKKTKQSDIKLLLQNLGVDNPDDAYNKLIECQKGEAITHQKLAFKRL